MTGCAVCVSGTFSVGALAVLLVWGAKATLLASRTFRAGRTGGRFPRL
ncbi:MAG: hypothetical protein IPH03_17770 [Tetrasphaera sp.]|nr:hypothetical protein [Tetrasphaera sp.]